MNEKEHEENEDEDDSKGGHGGSTSETEAEIWIPGFNDYLNHPAKQEELKILAEEIVLAQRLSVKAQGIEVHALNKAQKLATPKYGEDFDYTNNENSNNNSSGFDEHPELAPLDGLIDDTVVLPKNEAEARANQKNALKNKNKLAFKPNSPAPKPGGNPEPELKERPTYRTRPLPKPPGF